MNVNGFFYIKQYSLIKYGTIFFKVSEMSIVSVNFDINLIRITSLTYLPLLSNNKKQRIKTDVLGVGDLKKPHYGSYVMNI
jgi:hypothetical protein